MDTVDEIKSRLSIEELVGQYVQLKKIGRNLKGLCPFHNEKTPSFIVSPDKGMAYCFGCRKGGDVFAFIQEIENIDFPEAIRILAEKTGVEIKNKTFKKGAGKEKDRILILLEEAHKFFRKELDKSPEARNYLERRNYNPRLQKQFGLGFAPDSFHSLSEYLKLKGYKSKEILNAGLASQKNIGDSNIYDRFRNRVIFPIHDPQGKLVAFGGRTLSKDKDAAKYLNSPETEYYHKGSTLYCFHKAKKAIRDGDRAIIVEGYFDALTAHIHKYPQTVASLGTALTEKQIKLIGRFTKNLLFAFDADLSGQAAASRSIEIAQRLGFDVSIILIPSGKDPDDALQSNPEEWRKAVDTAVKAMDYELQKAYAETDIKTLDGKKQVLKSLLPIIQRLPSKVEQEHYLKKMAFELETSLKNLFSELQRTKSAFYPEVSTEAQESPDYSQKKTFSRAEHLLGILKNHPEHSKKLKNLLKVDFLATEDEKSLYKILLTQYNTPDDKSPASSQKNGGKPMQNEKKAQEDHSSDSRLQLLELYAEDKYSEFSKEELEQEVNNLCRAIRQDHRKRRLQSLRFQMAKDGSNEKLLKEYQDLLENKF